MSDYHVSEVAYFREQQALQEEAVRQGYAGFAMSARHDFIAARMKAREEHLLQLIAQGRHKEVQAIMETENWGIDEQGCGAQKSATMSEEAQV